MPVAVAWEAPTGPSRVDHMLDGVLDVQGWRDRRSLFPCGPLGAGGFSMLSVFQL